MSRKDKLTRQITALDRRKRRNLDDFPGAVLSGITGEDPPPGGCPNLGPTDAAQERCTIKTTAEVAGTPYNLVDLAQTAVIPGTDVISYCFEGKVGPPGGVIEIWCDGKFGLKESGLITKDLIDGVLTDGFWDRWVEKGGVWDLKYHDAEAKWWVRGKPTNYLPLVDYETDFLISQTTLDNKRDTFAIQAAVRRNNIGQSYTQDPAPDWPGEGSRFSMTGLVAPWKEGAGPAPEAVTYMGYQFQGFGGGEYGGIGRHNNLVFTIVYQNLGFSTTQQTFFVEDDYQEMYFIGQGQTGAPHTGTDAVNKNVLGGAGLATSRDFYNGVHWNAWSEWRDIIICTEKRIYFTEIPTGWYARIIPQSGLPSSQAAEAESTGMVIIPSDDGTSPVSGISHHKWPLLGFELYDDQPIADGGTGTLQEQCFPARGVYPGDIIEYDPDAGFVVGDGTIDVFATIELQILDETQTAIATYEPLGSKSEGFARGSRCPFANCTEILDIEIPWNARYLKFTPYKRGTGDGYACVRNLQVNTGGDVCCEFTIPGSDQSIGGGLGAVGLGAISEDDIALADLDADGMPERHVTVVLDPSRETAVDPDDPDSGPVAWTGEEIGDAYVEHRQGSQNIMGFDSSAEHAGPGVGTAGAPLTACGYDYDTIDIEDYGLTPGADTLSVRFKGKVG